MPMRPFVMALSLFFCVTLIAPPIQAQQDTSASQSATGSDTFEGVVSSASRSTLVVRTDDNDYHLFTYGSGTTRPRGLTPGARVRVTAGPADENGTRTASNVSVLSSTSGGQGRTAATTGDKGAQTAAVPEKVSNVESEIRREGRRWRLGVEAGQAFNPELFMFGVQSQMGPIFSPHVQFRPNAEFDFGEVTDLIALNLEAIYRLTAQRRGNWTPFFGAGPSLNFIHQSFQSGRNISFGNFDYETGFNVLVGMKKNRTFVELKSSLWSGPAPKLRVIVGYTF
jgi:hypothetical protein